MTNIAETWKVYLVKCADNSLYCGIAKDVAERVEKHNAGKGAKYTRSRLPANLAAVSSEMSKSEALKLEAHIKKQPADEKVMWLKKKSGEIL
jgi:putative endonuclease